MAEQLGVGADRQLSFLSEDARSLSPPSHAEACAICPVRHTALCRMLDDERVRELGAISEYRRFPPGETIFREGDARRFCFNIVSGMIRLYKLTAEGEIQVTGFLMPGDFMGLPMPGSVICSADAVGPTVLCCFPLQPLEGLLHRYPDLYAYFIGVLGREFFEMQEHMLWLGRKPAGARLAAFLIEFADHTARSGGRADRFLLPMRRVDIANFLGLTVETVSRCFTRLRERGLIALPLAERVRILDREGLERLVADS